MTRLALAVDVDVEQKELLHALHKEEIKKIHRNIENIVNTELMPLITHCNENVKWSCSPGIPTFAQSISNDKLKIKSEETFFVCPDYTIIADGHNPITLVAIFCSMVKIMHRFIQNDSDYLLWLQEKANITDRTKFDTLVRECCTKDFDVTWLWSRKRDGGLFTSTLNTQNYETLNETNLKYVDVSVSDITYGNTAVLMKKEVVQAFLNHLREPNRDGVDLFREDVTFERFVRQVYDKDKVAIVFEQDNHPIEYDETLPSSHDSRDA